MSAEGGDDGLQIEKAVFGGDGLARSSSGEVQFVPFVLPGERAQVRSSREGAVTAADITVLQPSPHRVLPRCVHFGRCGGCQYQMANYPAQLEMKAVILRETLLRAGVREDWLAAAGLQVWSLPEAYGYRNRIRLRVFAADGERHLGYNMRGTQQFLPVTMCPIAAPLLWTAAKELLQLCRRDAELAAWVDAAAEVELFCDGAEAKLQVTLLLEGKAPRAAANFARAMGAWQAIRPELVTAAAVRVEARSGRTLEVLANWGAAGLLYRVGETDYWITRGAFFQVNRFLLLTLVGLVCDGRSGRLAWDLFAGVGLFSRVLAGQFGAVTAVEANPIASADLRRALRKLGPQHRVEEAITLDFLRRATVERERPELIVLDPPRAGAGEEACRLLGRLAPQTIVYLSCDPVTLARDLRVLAETGYSLEALHLIDLFPQTYHLETLAVLRRA